MKMQNDNSYTALIDNLKLKNVFAQFQIFSSAIYIIILKKINIISPDQWKLDVSFLQLSKIDLKVKPVPFPLYA